MGAAFGLVDVAVVVDGEEDVSYAGEVGEGFLEGEGVGRVHEEEGHGGAEENDAGVLELREGFMLDVSIRCSVVGSVKSGI